MALVAVHLGEVDENKINDMSYLFLESILLALGKKLNYDAVVNYAGNSYFEKSWEVITENNPMNVKKTVNDRTGIGSMIEAMNAGKIVIQQG